MMKILNSRLVILLEYQYRETFFQKAILQIDYVTKVKNTVPWTYVISDLKSEEIVGTFYKKELQEANQKELRV